MSENRKMRVWWIPQVPMTPFYKEVTTLEQAAILIDTLAEYDLFQFENNIKPDYSNAGGLMILEADGQWVDWTDDDYGFENLTEYLEFMANHNEAHKQD